MPRVTPGFTLIELLITLAVFGILTSLAIPSMLHFQQSQQLRNTSMSLWSDLTLARTEALKRGMPVMVAAMNGQWTEGWQVFADRNKNGIQDADEASLREHGVLAKDVVVRGNAPVQRYIRFTSDGRSKQQGGAFQAGSVSICHSNGEHSLRKLILSATGRVRFAQLAPGPC